MAIIYELLGRKIEDMPTATNYDTAAVKDVTGVTDVSATTGTATTAMSPVTFNKDSKFARFLDRAFERGLELSELEVDFLNVRYYKRVGATYEAGKPVAYKQKAVVVPDSYAPGNGALEMSATLNWSGEKTFGTYDKSTSTFTPETAEPADSTIHYREGDSRRQDYKTYFVTDGV